MGEYGNLLFKYEIQSNIIVYNFAFQGKQLHIKTQELPFSSGKASP